MPTSVTRFGEILKTLGNCLRVYLLFAKTLNHIWTFFNAIGRILTVKKGKNLKNNSAIWSHCQQTTTTQVSDNRTTTRVSGKQL